VTVKVTVKALAAAAKSVVPSSSSPEGIWNSHPFVLEILSLEPMHGWGICERILRLA